MEENPILIPISIVTRSLFWMIAVLVCVSILVQVARFQYHWNSDKGVVPLFDLDGEENVPSYFSIVTLLFAGGLLGVIGLLNKVRKEPFVSRWFFLSVWFFLMAYDEGFQVHEGMSAGVKIYLGNVDHGLFHFAWVIPALAFLAALVIFLFRFLAYLPPKTRRAFLISGLIYISGAVGMEMLDGFYADLYGYDHLFYKLLTDLEEFLEMTGNALFIISMLMYLRDHFREIRIWFV